MPERVYMNRCAGEERIEVQVTADEIAELLKDLEELWISRATPATARLIKILRDSAEQFEADAVARSKEQPR